MVTSNGALGAVLAFWHLHLKKERKINRIDDMQGSFLGPMYKEKEIRESLDKLGANYKLLEKISVKIAKISVDGKAVGWFQGRMEFGPRALGGRSILADPRNKNMQKCA